MPKGLKFSNNKLDELVEAISLSHYWMISEIPSSDLLPLKKDLESREELSDYIFRYSQPITASGNYLFAQKIYGGQKNA